jgi:hypothetical protein
VHVLGAIRASSKGPLPEYIEPSITSVTVCVLRREPNQPPIRFDCTHLLDFTARGELERKIEARYRLFKRHVDAAPIYDFDTQEPA